MASAAVHSPPRELELECLLARAESAHDGSHHPGTGGLRLPCPSTNFTVVLPKTTTHAAARASNVRPTRAFGTLK